MELKFFIVIIENSLLKMEIFYNLFLVVFKKKLFIFSISFFAQINYLQILGIYGNPSGNPSPAYYLGRFYFN